MSETREPRARPRDVCRELLAALDAAEGRRRRRKRDTAPDAIGLALKRELLLRAIEADPDPDDFEAWLAEQCLAAGAADGGLRAIALSILDEWQLAHTAESFRSWLAQGAPSDDTLPANGRDPAETPRDSTARTGDDRHGERGGQERGRQDAGTTR